jgi:hypothetical protein
MLFDIILFVLGAVGGLLFAYFKPKNFAKLAAKYGPQIEAELARLKGDK